VTAPKFTKPRLPSHYYVWSEPPDAAGDESLHFVSERRKIKLKGHSFREFERRVIPLLDGEHTLEDIGRKVEDVFALDDLAAGLELLASQNLLENGPQPESIPTSPLTPQFNFFHEIGMDISETHQRLRNATITVFGLSGAGPGIVESLAAAGLGTIRCVDNLIVSASDIYLSSSFKTSDIGSTRSDVIQRNVAERSPATQLAIISNDFTTDDAVVATIEGSDFVVVCLDVGQSSLIYKVNRACLKLGIRWTSCALSGTEVTVGPTVHPNSTPCYLCYKMRTVACAGNPEDAFAYEKMLDRRKKDDSSHRENLVFGSGIAANMLALEALREIIGLTPVPTQGKVVIFDLLDLSTSKHVVLRKPWCPACYPIASADKKSQPSESR
jgi:bacteriocin biosynthesis cyclodehydratase domain-containing protein